MSERFVQEQRSICMCARREAALRDTRDRGRASHRENHDSGSTEGVHTRKLFSVPQKDHAEVSLRWSKSKDAFGTREKLGGRKFEPKKKLRATSGS